MAANKDSQKNRSQKFGRSYLTREGKSEVTVAVPVIEPWQNWVEARAGMHQSVQPSKRGNVPYLPMI